MRNDVAGLARSEDPESGFVRSLDADDCRRLLAPGGVGRVLVSTAHGPAAFPVNYIVLSGAIVFRASEGSVPASAGGVGLVGFEVDRIDEVNREGWSVQVTGPARRIDEPVTVWLLHDLIKPWPPGDHDVCVRIDPVHVSGRHVRADRRPD
ncbi:pyridoxamine 5'-phosphate oxidase family protein [Actinomadura barringtoniae]|uniref:Pyridoxamine 5'-phosphate oxidase family protein n=1 Tax=Actinomadura barringtoniae TaxID=1427535 RepID=A0A939TG88_9ACTN|nr:pyridoxamine 5'-phosphate oxidase family protein [Actinomadura barringtoniae]MBO2455185.1 pyridoxamine 5'-phosphate oxidase family protein [Actinomadura barringtoniae]